MAINFFGNKEQKARERALLEANAAETLRALNNPKLAEATIEVETQAKRTKGLAEVFSRIKNVLSRSKDEGLPDPTLEELLEGYVLRPQQPEVSHTKETKKPKIVIDPDHGRVTVDSKSVKLSQLDIDILYQIASGEIITTKMLAEKVYGASGKKELWAMAKGISSLTTKLGKAGLKGLVHSDRKRGYSINDKDGIDFDLRERAKRFELTEASKRLDRTETEIRLAIKNKLLVEGKHYVNKGKGHKPYLTVEGIKFISDGNLDKAYLREASEMSKNWKRVTPWTPQEIVALSNSIIGLANKEAALNNRGVNIVEDLAILSSSCSEIVSNYTDAVKKSQTNVGLASDLGYPILYRADVTKAFFRAKLNALAKNPQEARSKRFGNKSDKNYYNQLVSDFLSILEGLPNDKRTSIIDIATSVPSITVTTNFQGYVLSSKEENTDPD